MKTTRECKNCGAVFYTDEQRVKCYSHDRYCDSCDVFFKTDEDTGDLCCSREDCQYDPCCPECGSTELQGGGHCKMCGKPLKSGQYLCSDCKSELDEHKTRMYSEMRKNRAVEIDEPLYMSEFLDGLAEYLEIILYEYDDEIKETIRRRQAGR